MMLYRNIIKIQEERKPKFYIPLDSLCKFIQSKDPTLKFLEIKEPICVFSVIEDFTLENNFIDIDNIWLFDDNQEILWDTNETIIID